jgi:hypothetical protein
MKIGTREHAFTFAHKPFIMTANKTPSGEEITAFWTIYRSDLKGPPYLTFPDGQKAVTCFTSEERARNFHKAAFPERECKFVEMPPHVFVEWLRRQIKGGRHFVYRDPMSFDRLGKRTPILNVLMAIE